MRLGHWRPGDEAKHQYALIPGQPHILLHAHWDQTVTNLPVCQSAVANTCMTFDTITYSSTTIQRTFYTLNYCERGIGMGLWHRRNVRLQNVRLTSFQCLLYSILLHVMFLPSVECWEMSGNDNTSTEIRYGCVQLYACMHIITLYMWSTQLVCGLTL